MIWYAILFLFCRYPLSRDHIEVFKILVKNGINIDHRIWIESKIEGYKTYFSVLHVVCCKENQRRSIDERENTIDFLIENGVNINQSARDFFPVLHFVAKSGLLNLLKILLKHERVRKNIDIIYEYWSDGDKGIGDWIKNTPLNQAIQSEQTECAIYLMENGANIFAVDK